MCLIIRKENIPKLMEYRQDRITNPIYKNQEWKFIKRFDKRNKTTHYSLAEFANEPQELISNWYSIDFLQCVDGFLTLNRCRCGGWRNGDSCLWDLIKLGIVEMYEGKEYKTIYE